MPSDVDDLDARLLALLDAEPRIGVAEAARRLGVARNTAMARLQRLEDRGALVRGGHVAPVALGFPVLAFVFLEIAQGRLDEAMSHLRRVPEVLEVHGVTGPRDLLCRIVARDPGDLQDVINRIVANPAVRRSTSHLAMSEQIAMRTGPLVELVARDAEGGRRGATPPPRAGARDPGA